MYGDYEAQRHWQEITYNLPVKQWYDFISIYIRRDHIYAWGEKILGGLYSFVHNDVEIRRLFFNGISQIVL